MLVVAAFNGERIWGNSHGAVRVQVAVALKASNGRSWGRIMCSSINIHFSLTIGSGSYFFIIVLGTSSKHFLVCSLPHFHSQ